jgi:hypothetical protein
MMGYDNFEKELDRKLLKLKEEKLKIWKILKHQ